LGRVKADGRACMNRSHATDAIVLRTHRIGEIHRGVVLLSRDSGLIRAIAHGANSPRGKLRGSTVVLAAGTAFLYTNPRTQSTKITDMDSTEFFPAIRSDLQKYFTACLWSEVVLKSFGSGGGPEAMFDLLVGSLRLLDGATSATTDLVSVQFLWRFLGVSGSQPDLELCAGCGESIARGDDVVYVPEDHGFCSLAHDCSAAPAESVSLTWSSGTRMYLRHSANLSLDESVRVSPPPKAGAALKRVLYYMVQDLVETPLNTLKSGAGII